MQIYTNPFKPNSEKHEVWNILIKNDFEGFLDQNWEFVASDYLEPGFFGINMNKTSNTELWQLSFPSLASYKNQWINDSIEFKKNNFDCDPREVFYATTHLENFEFFDNVMMVHKVFDGELPIKNGPSIPLNWRSLFVLRKEHSRWQIASFTGYI